MVDTVTVSGAYSEPGRLRDRRRGGTRLETCLHPLRLLRRGPSLDRTVTLLRGQVLHILQRRNNCSSLDKHLGLDFLQVSGQVVPLWPCGHAHLLIVLLRVLEGVRHLVNKVLCVHGVSFVEMHTGRPLLGRNCRCTLALALSFALWPWWGDACAGPRAPTGQALGLFGFPLLLLLRLLRDLILKVLLLGAFQKGCSDEVPLLPGRLGIHAQRTEHVLRPCGSVRRPRRLRSRRGAAFLAIFSSSSPLPLPQRSFRRCIGNVTGCCCNCHGVWGRLIQPRILHSHRCWRDRISDGALTTAAARAPAPTTAFTTARRCRRQPWCRCIRCSGHGGTMNR
mmetsp:Transcript_133317/g.285066  ORF Transcript_133317/g.285066 Transcript_133317/m.285066 type:complete len:337 (-) Transcript_133317:29-1039(-)